MEVQEVITLYGGDFNESELSIQLEIAFQLACSPNFSDASCNAASERCFSTMNKVKG